MLIRPLLTLVSALVGALGGFSAPDAVVTPAALSTRTAGAVAAPAPIPPCPSYWVVDDGGSVFTAGGAPFAGSAAGSTSAPAVGVAATPDGSGYWLATADGRVQAFGSAADLGGVERPGSKVVALTARPGGGGYWMATAGGGVFTFGRAGFYGALAGRANSAPVVGMVATPSGRGYWVATADGGIFTFGDATFRGAATGVSATPIVGIAATPTGRGYWLAAADGGVFSFGDARFRGSAAAAGLRRPVTAIVASPFDSGYWLAAADGRVLGFGDARAAAPVRYPSDASRVVAMATPAHPLPCPAATGDRKVVLLGDSVMFDLAGGLEPALRAIRGVDVASRPWFAYGLDLSRDTYDWRVEWPAVLESDSPDVVVVLVGYGDLWAPRTAPAAQRPETEVWRSRYRVVVEDAVRVATAGGARLVWIGLPWVADTNIYFPDVRARVESANGVAREVIGRTPNATFVDGAALLAGPDGRFASALPDATGRLVPVRKPDGLHLCPAGVERLAGAVAADVGATVGAQVRAGWQEGAWRDDPRYQHAAGAGCG